MDLSDFEVISFDCYGTLIDWESGILAELQPWLARADKEIDAEDILEAYGAAELAQERADPAALYPEILKRTFLSLARGFSVSENEDEAERFARSVGNWPAFADSAAALAELKKRFRLVILSNVDRASFAAGASKLGVAFDAVYTAEEIGSYKPDARNFDFLIRRLGEQGIAKEKILHAAQSVVHDLIPAKAQGLRTAWIHRRFNKPGWGATAAPGRIPESDFLFTSMAAFAAAS